MRKQFFLLPLLCATSFLISCRKENQEPAKPHTQDYQYLVPKIKSWLDEQKTGVSVVSSRKIDSLKLNLNYDGIRLEKYKGSQEFIIIPVLSGFNSKNNSDKVSVNHLVLVFEKGDTIVTGNIIQYISSNSQRTVPKNTFTKIFNYQDIDCSGQFTILSITDHFRYELKFENGKIKSVKAIKEKKQSGNSAGRVNECIDWYEQTWFVWADGTVELVSEVYVFTTCDDDCVEAKIANGRSYGSTCNDGGGGGGVEYDPCISAAVSAFQSETNGGQPVSKKKGSEISTIDEITKNKNPKWTIFEGWSSWTLESQEIGVIKLIDPPTNRWAWKSLVHGSITMVGTPTPGVGIDYNQGVGTPSFTPETAASTNVFYAGMSLNYNITYRFLCNCPNLPVVNLIPSVMKSYNSTAIWDSNPI